MPITMAQRILSQHGHESRIDEYGTLSACTVYTNDSSSIEVWEPITLTVAALAAWLGY